MVYFQPEIFALWQQSILEIFGHDFSLNSKRITKDLDKYLPKIQNHKIENKTLEHTINTAFFLNNANFLNFFVKSPMIFWEKNRKLGRKFFLSLSNLSNF
jgi:hypothetical protein